MAKPVDTKQESGAYNISVAGRHVMVTEPMKQYAMDKIHKLDRISDRIIDVHVTMDIQKLEHRVSITMSVGNIFVKVSAATEDMYASIDLALDKLRAKLRKYKSRIQEHHGKALHVVDMNVNVIRNPSDEELVNEAIEEVNQQQLEEEYRPHEIVRKTTMPLKTLTFEEAIMKMELSDAHFKVFRNEEDQKLKVIYRLEEGDYGVIEPE